MKERKLVIEIDDNAIDSVIEKVRLLKEELRSLSLPINISDAVPAALKARRGKEHAGCPKRIP
ncbi:hypothetical protein LNO88_11765 [Klebsiella pneumoniae subsp. pneumoniae]|nr:hypothetical protein [Klebsiella pneumoniae subsp. pneumoniae]